MDCTSTAAAGIFRACSAAGSTDHHLDTVLSMQWSASYLTLTSSILLTILANIELVKSTLTSTIVFPV